MPAISSVSAPPRAALVFVLLAYVLPLVVPVPLMEDDEGLHAAIAIEMVERGDWTVPRLLGEPFLDKPILYFWMQAASLAAFGASEFAVRLPGTLVALAGAAAAGWLGVTLFGVAVGRWAAVIYATLLLPYAVSLSPLHDLVMVPLVCLALGAYWRAWRAVSPAPIVVWTLTAGVAVGLSMLGKGLTGVGLIGVGMVAWMIWTRTWSLRLVGVAAASLVLGALIAWPWYAAMEAASPGYLRYFIVDRHIGGIAGSEQRHSGRPFWYYLPVLAGGAWPWIAGALRRPLRQADVAERLVWAWLVADFVLLTLAGSKLATYLLPAFPAVALLAARQVVATDDTDAAPGWIILPTALLPMLGMVALSPPFGPPGSRAPLVDGTAFPLLAGALTLLTVVGALGPLLLAGVFSLTARGRQWSAPSRLLAVTALALVGLSLTVRPGIATQLTARQLAEHMNRLGTMPETLLIVDEGVGSFLFYLRPALRRGLTPERVQRISRFSLGDRRDPDGVLVAIATDRLAGVRELYDLPPATSSAVGSFFVVPFADVHPRQR